MGAYELVEPMGRGGSGLVYKAACGGRHFGVKVLILRFASVIRPMSEITS